MNDFIEAMARGHDNTKYRWVSSKCAETCSHCDFLNNQIKTMQRWQAEGLPQTLGKAKYHNCGSECCCRLEKVKSKRDK